MTFAPERDIMARIIRPPTARLQCNTDTADCCNTCNM